MSDRDVVDGAYSVLEEVDSAVEAVVDSVEVSEDSWATSGEDAIIKAAKTVAVGGFFILVIIPRLKKTIKNGGIFKS